MKFILDAQLPPSLKLVFLNRNFACNHTLDLKDKNNTSDTDIRTYCEAEDVILITKVDDFYYTHLLNNKPRKLILVKVGNCSKVELITIFQSQIERILERIQIENLIFITK